MLIKQILVAIIIFTLIPGFSLARIPEQPVPEKEDALHFLTTFPDLEKDPDRFGFETADLALVKAQIKELKPILDEDVE